MRRAGTSQGKGMGARLAGWLAVLPFLLLSLVMPGTMLARDALGGVTVVLCAEGGMAEMVMAADGSLGPPRQLPPGHACDWAPHGLPLMPGPVVVAPPPHLAVAMPVTPAPVTVPARPARVPPPVARGPPPLV